MYTYLYFISLSQVQNVRPHLELHTSKYDNIHKHRYSRCSRAVLYKSTRQAEQNTGEHRAPNFVDYIYFVQSRTDSHHKLQRSLPPTTEMYRPYVNNVTMRSHRHVPAVRACHIPATRIDVVRKTNHTPSAFNAAFNGASIAKRGNPRGRERARGGGNVKPAVYNEDTAKITFVEPVRTNPTCQKMKKTRRGRVTAVSQAI